MQQCISSGVDHVILGVEDLDECVRIFGTLLGLRVTGGGTHPAFGTRNRIIVLGEEYIELIAAEPDETPRGFLGEMLSNGHRGWIGYALQTPDPAQTATFLRDRGFAVDGPHAGRLETGDAFSRGWDTVRLAKHEASELPFLIRHHTSGQDRQRVLAGKAGMMQHPLRPTGIADLTIAASELASGIETYQSFLGINVESTGTAPMLAADTATMRLNSTTTITLAAPEKTGVGLLAQSLSEHGPGLFAITIAVEDLPCAVHFLRGNGVGVRVDEPDGHLVAAQLNHRQLLGARIALVAREAQRPANA